MRRARSGAAILGLLLVPAGARAQELAPPSTPINTPAPQPLAPPQPLPPGQLAPPAPMGPNGPTSPSGPTGPAPAPGSTEAELQKAEEEDSGRNFELVYVNADFGGSYINMQQFSQDKLALVKSDSGGIMAGLGAGVRLLVFTLGARARFHHLGAFDLWQLGGEGGFHIPIGRLDPYILVHGGYAFTGSLSDSGDAKVHGFNAGASLGGDYYLSALFSIGIDGTADFLFLQRPPAPLPSNLTADQKAQLQAQPLYANSGSSAGFGLSGSLHFGLHFGF